MVALAAVTALAACGEREVILPGERLHLREILQGPAAEPDPGDAEVENRALPLALPPPQVNPDWAQGIGSPRHRPVHPALSHPLEPIWSVGIGQGDSRRQRITTDPVVADGRIFTIDAASALTATSAAGETLWTLNLVPARDRGGEAMGGGLAVGDGTLFVTTGFGRLLAVDPATGAIRWDQKLDATGTGDPVYRDGLVYLVAGDTTAWAIEADTGRIRWQNDGVGDVRNVAGGPAPAFSDELVIFGYGSGELQAVFPQGGFPRWSSFVAGRREGTAMGLVGDITGGPVIDEGRVFAANAAGRIVAFDLENGERLWTADDGAFDLIWSAGGSIFLVSDRNELLRLDASDGSRIWGVELPRYADERPRRRAAILPQYGPVVAGGRLVVAGADEVIRVFDPQSGELVQTVPLPGGATTTPVVAGGTLYVVTKDGQLRAFR
ncbi:PQQ-binding-like beta-propeller repeat protein [Rhodosalinus sp.]|uniref:PQQ-like beta-propeller repeat protein n=1 Tax=Rhodosalinus sp. TaxID=2047741 RepID=UPI00397D76B8